MVNGSEFNAETVVSLSVNTYLNKRLIAGIDIFDLSLTFNKTSTMKASLFFAALLVGFTGFSQDKMMPELKTGTKFQAIANVNGQEVPLGLRIDSLVPEFFKLGWSVEGYGEGSWVMKKTSLQSGTGGMGENPEPGVETVVPDDKIQFVFSKDQWAALMKDKKVKHNGVEYNVVPMAAGNEFKLDNKIVDVIYLETADKNAKLWVLNNAAMPFFVKSVGNPNGPDVTILTVQNPAK
jgi:hypothetical protein